MRLKGGFDLLELSGEFITANIQSKKEILLELAKNEKPFYIKLKDFIFSFEGKTITNNGLILASINHDKYTIQGGGGAPDTNYEYIHILLNIPTLDGRAVSKFIIYNVLSDELFCS